MGRYLVKRVLYMFLTVFLISIVAFVIIQVPPGDYLSQKILQMKRSGVQLDRQEAAMLEEQYGLNLPLHRQYLQWIGRILLEGDFGRSFEYEMPVEKVIGERLTLTIIMSLATTIFVWAISLPIGIYSATHQYSVGDYFATFFGFIGLAVPNFMLALVLMFLSYRWFGEDLGGLFSMEYLLAPWSLGRVWDLIKHLPIPIIVIGTAGTASTIRVLRGCLLDELRKQYVITARAKGVKERRLLFKYPVRIALNPIVSGMGGLLVGIVSGGTITAVVLSLPTTGPVLLNALRQQDLNLAASALFLLSILGVIGTFMSDILLVVVDPRIRQERGAST